jgi:hypothetical protein
MRLRSFLISIMTLLGIGVSVPAHASVGDVWAFAFNDKPSPGPVFTLMDPLHQWSPAGAANEIRALGTGHYEVRFAKTANKVGIPHVTTVNPKPHYCTIGGWQPNFFDGYQYVQVHCFAFGGVPDDSQFTVMFTGSSGFSPFGTDRHAYVHSAADGTMLDSYNSEGNSNFVGHGSTGEWKVRLDLSGPKDESGNFQVTAVSDRAARCKLTEWFPDSAGHTVLVNCFDENSKPVDTAWTLSYNRERPVVAAVGPPKRFGYTWVRPVLTPQTNFNSTGAVNTVMTFSPGVYIVTYPNLGLPEDHAQITAFGPKPDYCHLRALWTDTLGAARLRSVICFDASGAFADNDFLVAFTSRH